MRAPHLVVTSLLATTLIAASVPRSGRAQAMGAGRPGQLATVKKLDVGGLSLRDVTIVAFTGLPFKGTDPARGVLGPYSWTGLLITLDYPHSRLMFRRGALPEPDGREIFGWSA